MTWPNLGSPAQEGCVVFRFKDDPQMIGGHSGRACCCSTSRTVQIPCDAIKIDGERGRGHHVHDVGGNRVTENWKSLGKILQSRTRCLISWSNCAFQSLVGCRQLTHLDQSFCPGCPTLEIIEDLPPSSTGETLISTAWALLSLRHQRTPLTTRKRFDSSLQLNLQNPSRPWRPVEEQTEQDQEQPPPSGDSHRRVQRTSSS